MCNKDSQNKEAIGKMIEWVTLDTSDTGLQYLWANGTYDPANPTKDVVASEVVMSKSDGKVAFLGDQNMFDVFTECNKFANGRTSLLMMRRSTPSGVIRFVSTQLATSQEMPLSLTSRATLLTSSVSRLSNLRHLSNHTS